MAFTYDVTTDRGKVRMLAADRVQADAIFDDDEIDAFLSMESSNIRRAAAMALDTIASDQALVLKVIKTLDLETDGAKLAGALRAQAQALRDQENETGAFAIAEMVNTSSGWQEKIWKDAMRSG